MTINHVFLKVSASKFADVSKFYKVALKPLGYTEMVRAWNDTLIGYGSDYPYLWVQALPEGQSSVPTHIAFDALGNEAIQQFHTEAIRNGGRENGGPGIRPQYGRQPYYAAFVQDPDGNNIEAVCVPK